MPVPKHIDSAKVLNTINPDKDVDGFHVVNVGRLSTGQDALVACTPTGCVMLAKAVLGKLDGINAVVIGRSNIVGKPVAQLLLAENCTVTIAHSKSKDLAINRAPSRPRHRRRGPPGNGERRLAETRRHSHRRRHQPHRTRRQKHSGGRLRFRVMRRSSRPHHPRPRRRRPHDDCVPALQYGARRLCDQGCEDAGDVSGN